MFVEIEGFLSSGCDQALEYVSTKNPDPHRECQWPSFSTFYMGHRPEPAERRSIFGRALQELPAEGGGEVRRASESAAQSNIKSAFIGVAKHRFRRLHSQVLHMPVRGRSHSFGEESREVKGTDTRFLGKDAKIQALRQVCLDILQYPHHAVVRNALVGQRTAPLETCRWAE